MITVYKLTDQEWCTCGPTKWGPGVTHTAPGTGDLCDPGWLHAYTSPRLAILLNPIHANIPDPILWEALTPEIGFDDHGIEIGVRHLTTMLIVPAPVYTTVQRVAFGILCVREVYDDAGFRAWAAAWLSGEDRSWEAADSADAAAAAYAYAYAYADRTAYAYAAYVYAAYAARAAKRAAYAAGAADAAARADSAAYAAADAAANAAYAYAANAAYAYAAKAAAAGKTLDLDALAIRALEIT